MDEVVELLSDILSELRDMNLKNLELQHHSTYPILDMFLTIVL